MMEAEIVIALEEIARAILNLTIVIAFGGLAILVLKGVSCEYLGT